MQRNQGQYTVKLLPWVSLGQSFRDAASLTLEVYTTGRCKGWKRNLLLLLICTLLSILLSGLLFLYLIYILDYKAEVAGGIAACVGGLLTVAGFLSKQMRCVSILFLLSCFMKKSRKLLLTAAISLVVIRNIRNTLDNLTGLFRSMICNLDAKMLSINVSPLDKYVKMLKWVWKILKGATDFGIFDLHPQLNISPRVDSELLRVKLADAQQNLSDTVKFVHTVTTTMSSISHRVFPALSFLLLLAVMARHVARYRNNMKYQNSFISSRFVSFDEKQRAEGKPHVLPLTPREAKLYFPISSPRVTSREGKAILKFGVPVCGHFVAWLIFIGVDVLMYFFVDIITRHLAELEPFNVPLIMNFRGAKALIGIPIEEEDQSKDFSYSVTLFEKKCLPKPKLLLYTSVVPLVAILITLFLMALMAGKLTQLRLMVCEQFFCTSADERVEHLHAKILRKRLKVKREGGEEMSLKSILFKPHFWCPLLFQPKEVAHQVTV